MMTDPVTDMLNRIKNAQAARKEQIVVPFSNFKYEIAKILEKEKFLSKVEKKGRKANKFLEIDLKYENKTPVVSGMRKVSKPGQRIYVPAHMIKPLRGGYGISIISTSKGLMTGRDAKRQKIGGEIICEVW